MTESFINKNGTLPRIISSLIVRYMRKTKGKLITVKYQAVKPTRSLLQNKYYWGVVIDYLSKEIGYLPEVMHEYMKQEFMLDRRLDTTATPSLYEMPDGKSMFLYRSTTDLTTVQFEEYIALIRNWAGEFLSLYIPVPNETQFNYTGFE